MKVLTFSERYMYPTRNGPPMLEQGDAYINVYARAVAYMPVNESTTLSFAVFAAKEDHHHDSLVGMCDNTDIRNNYWANNVMLKRVPMQYESTIHNMNDAQLHLNGTYHKYTAVLDSYYVVMEEEWHNVAFQLCPASSGWDGYMEGRTPIARIEGEIVFRNPYGFIPAELFGFLPFEGARMVAYVLFGMVYCYFYAKHYASTLHLHKAVLAVFLVALAEATTWYASYQQINLTGQPYCCPFPDPVVAALVLQIFRQTLSRSLLLVVSLGYGIVRPKLLPAEWVAVVVVTVLYFAAATAGQVSEIVLVHDIHGDSPESVMGYQIPELIMDVLFLSWIYMALGSTIRILTEFQQGYKLNLYKQLAFTIALFVALFAIATVFIMLDKTGIIKWPWQWAWAQQVMWEVLNFAVIAAVCIICCPSDNSRMLSYASQLPTEDPDDDEGMGGKGTGLDDDDDDDEFEYVYGAGASSSSPASGSKARGEGEVGEDGGGGGDGEVELSSWKGRLTSTMSSIGSSLAGAAGGSPRSGGGGFTALPSAEDEEFGLQGEQED